MFAKWQSDQREKLHFVIYKCIVVISFLFLLCFPIFPFCYFEMMEKGERSNQKLTIRCVWFVVMQKRDCNTTKVLCIVNKRMESKKKTITERKFHRLFVAAEDDSVMANEHMQMDVWVGKLSSVVNRCQRKNKKYNDDDKKWLRIKTIVQHKIQTEGKELKHSLYDVRALCNTNCKF